METERPILTRSQRIEFLKMLSKLSNNSAFERKFGLTASDITFYKKQFDVESQDDARRAYRKLEAEIEDVSEATKIEEIQKARDAEKTANTRLKEMELDKAKESAKLKKTLDPNAIRADDAKRQKLFAAQQDEADKAVTPEEVWQLPLEGSNVEKTDKIERFRKDIQYQGLQFCVNKYGVSPKQIKAEANRLGLKIRWDSTKR